MHRPNKLNKSLLTIAISSVLMTATAHAAWLKAVGTTGDDGYAYPIELEQGGYLVQGSTGSDNWYARIDANGKVLWAKSSGEVHIYGAEGGKVKLLQTQVIGEDVVIATATGNVDMNTGTISNILPEKSKKIVNFNNQVMFYNEQSGLVQNSIVGANGAISLAFGKLDANNNLLWSHLYDSGQYGNGQAMSLKSGFLLRTSDPSTNSTPSAPQYKTKYTLLNDTGTIIANSSKQIAQDDPGYGIKQLADGSIILMGNPSDTENRINLIKLDSNLNFIWGKSYSLAAADFKFSLSTLIQLTGGELELHAEKQKFNLQIQPVESHPVVVRINPTTGAVVSKKELQVSQVDPGSPSWEINQYSWAGKVNLNGNDQGLFALFNVDLQKEWARTINGINQDYVSAYFKADKGGYLLYGDTNSWGVGGKDMLLGKLDKNGTVADCAAIQSVNVNIVDPDIAVADVANPLVAAADPVDKGSFSITVTEQNPTLNLNLVDYPVTVTDICSAAEPAAGVMGVSGNVVNFSKVLLNNSNTQEVTLTNTGDAPLTINSITGLTAPFSKTLDNCSGKTIPAAGNCKLGFKFTPTAPGDFSVNAVINSTDAANNPVTLTLTGTGTTEQPTLEVPMLSATDIGAGSKITLNGQGFTSKKGQVKVGSKSAVVSSWRENSIEFKLPTNLKAGTYVVQVITKKNGKIAAGNITVHAPEISSLSALTGKAKDVVTVSGNYFGATGKPKVYWVSDKNKKTAVTVLKGYNDKSVSVRMPKLRPGTYRVLIGNTAGQGFAGQAFTYQ